MLKIGAIAPNFTFKDPNKIERHLHDYLGKKVVLFFFPKAFSKGCTIETRLFRDHYAELSTLGAEVMGISTDNNDVQCSFAEKEKIPFTMIGDKSGEIGKLYHALWPIFGINQRVTYIINEDGKIGAVFHHEIRVEAHIRNVREYLLASSKK